MCCLQLPNGGIPPSTAAPAVWPPAFQPGQMPQQSFPSLAAAACSAGMAPAGPGWGAIPLPWNPPFGQPQPGYGQVSVPGFPVAPPWPGQTFLPPLQQPAGSQPSMIGMLPTGPPQQGLPANGQPAVSLPDFLCHHDGWRTQLSPRRLHRVLSFIACLAYPTLCSDSQLPQYLQASQGHPLQLSAAPTMIGAYPPQSLVRPAHLDFPLFSHLLQH